MNIELRDRKICSKLGWSVNESLVIWREYLASSISYHWSYTKPLELYWMNWGNCRNQKRCECGSESKSKKHMELIIHDTLDEY